MSLSTELKQAISHLPSAEKDKLLFRLLRKDPDMCQRLYFELVEEGDSLAPRREEIQAEMQRILKFDPYSPGYLMMDLRTLNGTITRHVKHTRDKQGEIHLTLYMLRSCLELHGAFIIAHLHRADSLQNYLVKRLETVLEKLSKIHQDLFVEYEADVNYLLTQLHTRIAPIHAHKAKLPKQWPD